MIVKLAVAALLFAMPAFGFAQGNYPNRPVKMVVPFVAGGPADVVGRIMAADLSVQLNQSVVVENKSGAGIVVGTESVAKSAPDGYTILLATIAHPVASSMFKSIPFDPIKDFAPVGLIGSVPLVMVVRPTLNVQHVKDFVQLAKANPGKFNFGSAGNGAVDHLSSALFSSRTAIDVVHVKYRGTAPAILDLVAGRLDFIISTSSVMLPHIKSGSVTALAVAHQTRLATLPAVPTMAEEGIANLEMSAWYSLLFPANVPQATIDRMNAALKQSLAEAATRKRLQDIGALIADNTSPQYLATYIADEQARWAGVLKSIGFQPE
jgi:tripartite-type tricarboxylate transporter receptor subunit TctC